jgi:PIN domain nuclease of toxin-antitoxin system
LEILIPTVVPFDLELAVETAALAPLTASLGLSLGDRACIATGIRLGAKAVTADRKWSSRQVKHPVLLIR